MWTRLWNKLRSLRSRDGFGRDLDEELDFHREMLEHDNARRGLDGATSASSARRAIGNLSVAREEARRAWAFGWIEELTRDLRLAFRGYRRSPGFAFAAIAVLALGVGANMAVFRFVDAVVFETLPVPRPHELVRVAADRRLSYPAFQTITEGSRDVLASTAAVATERVNLTSDGRAEYLPIEVVSGGFFETLGVRPALGRLLTNRDDGAEGAHPVCVISYGLWQRMFAGSPDVVGTFVRLHNEPFEIVGVTERGFQGVTLHSRSDAQVPMSMLQAVGGNPRDAYGARFLSVLGRLAPGVTREQAEGIVRGRFDQLEQTGTSSLAVAPGHQGFGAQRYILLDAVLIAQMLSACVLLIACASLAGLLLARTSARRPEMAMRLALGASRRRLVVQLVIEVAGLAAAAGVVAVGLSMALDSVLLQMLAGPDTPLHIRTAPSGLGVLAAIALLVTTVVAIGLLPAVWATRKLPLNHFRDAARMTTGTNRLGGPLVVAQVAVCLVLVFGAGLLGRSLYNLRTTDLGLDPDRVVVVTAGARQAGYTRETERAYYDDWLHRARRIPGVAAVSFAAITALSHGMFAMSIDVADAAPRDSEPNNNFNVVTPDYFLTVGLPIIAGRSFLDADAASAPGVAIVNERFVEHYWPGQSPIGRQFNRGKSVLTVVGLVPTAKYQSVREEPQITIYLPLAQQAWGEVTLHARVTGDPDPIATALVQAARQVDPAVPVYGATTLNEHVNARLANERVLNVLGMMFGTLALAVAAAGLYGTVAYAVARRIREIGIRKAIGAQRHDIVRLLVMRLLGFVAVGVVVGIPIALAAGRWLGAVLYNVDPTSVSTMTLSALVLVGVAILAALLPAVRGAGASAVVALKES